MISLEGLQYLTEIGRKLQETEDGEEMIKILEDMKKEYNERFISTE